MRNDGNQTVWAEEDGGKRMAWAKEGGATRQRELKKMAATGGSKWVAADGEED